jgi:hypothetical protein
MPKKKWNSCVILHIYTFVYTYICKCICSPTRATAREHFNPFRGEILTPSVIHFYRRIPRTYSHNRNKYKYTKTRFLKKVNILFSIKSKHNYADLLFDFPMHRKLCETSPMCSPISTAVGASYRILTTCISCGTLWPAISPKQPYLPPR